VVNSFLSAYETPTPGASLRRVFAFSIYIIASLFVKLYYLAAFPLTSKSYSGSGSLKLVYFTRFEISSNLSRAS